MFDGRPVQAGRSLLKPPRGEVRYDLYVPTGYNADPKETFPILFMFSAGGTPTMSKFKERMKSGRYIVALLPEVKNGPYESAVASFCAAHDDAVRGTRVADGFKYITGFSAGGRAASLCCGLRPGFVGLFLQSCGSWGDMTTIQQNRNLAVFITIGDQDAAAKELVPLFAGLPPTTPRKMMVFSAGHTGPTPELVQEGFDWLERWTYFGATPTAAGKAMYLRYFNQLVAESETAPNEILKLDLLEQAEKFAKSRLAKEKEPADELKTIRATLADLAKSDAVKKEMPARTEYLKVVAMEEAARSDAKASVVMLKGHARTLKQLYQDVAQKFPESVYGTKAAQAAARTKLEAD